MKTNIFITILLLCIFGCTSKQNDDLNLQQKEQIKKEITVLGDSMMARWQRMDVEGAMQYYSPDFVCFGSDGEHTDFEGYKKYTIESFKSATSYKWTFYRQTFIAITKDTVVCAWDGKNELFMKSGDKMIAEPSHYTFAFKKIEGKWKLAYHHFSGTFAIQKADKK
jgi:ketosteroid isomerase-like protein